MLEDFKAFIARGNVLDLAIGVIIGAAFGTVVKTFTDGIIMPFVGMLTSGTDFKHKFWDITGAIQPGLPPEELQKQIDIAAKAGKPLVLYGQFISDIITFLIVAVVMFFLARYAVHLFKGLEAKAAPPTAEEVLLTEIRDLLKAK
ncbi:MAG: large conductance mechanosensitive channel protein MscL [Acidobacteriota bacterium]